MILISNFDVLLQALHANSNNAECQRFVSHFIQLHFVLIDNNTIERARNLEIHNEKDSGSDIELR